MKEQLINFKTAKLAKEKGFAIGIKTTYCQYYEPYEYDGDPNHRESYKKGDIYLIKVIVFMKHPHKGSYKSGLGKNII